MKENFESKDKQVVPFLLTQQGIEFRGTKLVGSTLYFEFAPRWECERLVNDFSSHKAPLVDPKALLEAVETFRDYVFGMRERMKENGKDFRVHTNS